MHRRPLKARTTVLRSGAGALECVVRGVVALVLLAAAVAFAGLALGPRTGAYRTVTMLTGSMSPQYPAGSVLLVRPLPADELRVGDVLTYQIPVDDHRVVSHRVIDATRAADGALVVHTKGDANNGPDPWVARIAEDHVWTVRAAVPHVGSALMRMRDPSYRPILLYGVPAVLLLWTLAGIWRERR